MLQKQKSGFTLVELIVVIVILAVLATIGYIALLGYGATSRDTTRIANLVNIGKVVEIYEVETGNFPPTTDPIDITFSGSVIWEQGSFGDETRAFAQRISEVPIDPLTFAQFAYSRTKSTGEYQVGTIVEKKSSIAQTPLWITTQSHANESVLANFATTKIKGNYNGKFIFHTEEISPEETRVYMLGVPTILVNEITNVDLETIFANSSFVYEGGPAAPATYSGAVQDQGNWDFTPTNTTSDDFLIFTGSLDDINSGTGKLDIIDRLKDYYASTDIEQSHDYDELKDIDTNEDPKKAIELVNAYIESGLVNAESSDVSKAVCAIPWGGNVISGVSITAYQSSTVPYGSSCSSETRTCNNGVFSGTYTNETCTVDAADTTPNAFNFPDISNQTAGVSINSSIITITGINTNTPVSITGQGSPEFRINGGAWLTNSTVTNGDTLEIRLTSPSTGLVTWTATINVGGVTDDFSITTVADICVLPWGGNTNHSTNVTAYQSSTVPYGSSCSSETRSCNNGTLSGTYTNETCTVDAADTIPNAYNFPNETHQTISTSVSSNIITITGINELTPVSISGQGSPEFRINGGSWGTSGSITNGQSLQVRLTSSSNGLITRTATVNVGGVTDTYAVTTQADNCTRPWGGTVNHGSSITAYQASSVPFGSSCVSQTRTCNNGTLSGSYGNSSCSVSAPDTYPSSYNFTDRTNQSTSSSISSNIITITGINASTPVSISGQGSPQFRINGGSWGTSGNITNGQILQLRLTSASSGLSTRTATVNVGGRTDTYAVTTSANNCTRPWGGTVNHGSSVTAYQASSVPYGSSCVSHTRTCTNGSLSGSYTNSSCSVASPDTYPSSYNFTDRTNQSTSASISSNTVTITGINASTPVSISGQGGPQFRISGGSWRTSGNINNGQSLQLRLTSASSGGSTRTATVNVGGRTDSYAVTTVTDSYPSSYNFANKTNQTASSTITSNTVTISGINVSTPVSISGQGSPQFRINGGSWRTSGNITNGQSLQLRLTTASGGGSTRTATVNVGGRTDSYAVTTAADTYPGSYNFTNRTNQSTSSSISSNTVTITGINAPTPVSISGQGGPQFRISGGSWRTSGNINNGQSLQLRLTSASSGGVTRTATVNVGGRTDAYAVTTTADTYPSSYNFANKSNQSHGTRINSNTVTIGGINASTPVSISGQGSPQFRINGGSWRTSGNITNGQSLQLRLTSASSGGATRTATVNVGGRTDAYAVTTSADTYPNSFSFSTHNNAPPGAYVHSNTVTITGINASTPISISGNGNRRFRINGGSWRSSGTITNGQTVQLRILSSSETTNTNGSAGRTRSATLNVGGRTASWSVITECWGCGGG